MLIVSQNEEVQFMLGAGYRIKYFDSCGDKSYCVTISDIEEEFYINVIGSYKSKERAMRVMYEIRSAYKNNERVFILPED